MSVILYGRIIKEGRGQGTALVSTQPLSFLGGVDATSGVVKQPGHDLEGQSLAGRVLVFPRGQGSTVGSYIIYALAAAGLAPAAMVLAECEPIVALGAIMAGIPVVDGVDIGAIATGDAVIVEGAEVRVG